ncbi:uncharacterized protein LOC116936563 isoform X1 [Daphnia magna]|uniref:uncharacterized protein LOC116936563 isoform X1 n=2 Tax=Daphnia magna TaxID=35525 RepID=UPI001402EB97|nr:uncharacterized protein LOC116936563 isoform X1 [Daphnia magna]
MCCNLRQCCTSESWLRLGAIIVGVLSVTQGIMGFILASFGATHILPYYTGNKKFLSIFLIMVVITLNMIVCSVLLLIVAVKNRNQKLLLPWLIVGASTFTIGIIIIYLLLNLVAYIGPSSIVALLFWLVVYSYYQQLEKNQQETFTQFIF